MIRFGTKKLLAQMPNHTGFAGRMWPDSLVGIDRIKHRRLLANNCVLCGEKVCSSIG